MELDIDLTNPMDRKMLGKMKRGMPVQLKPEHLQGMKKNVKVALSEDKMKKMMKAMRLGKGVRVCLDPEESEMMEGVEFTSGGRVKSIEKAFKKVGKDIKKGLKKTGEELKKVPKYYRKNIRQYTQPIAKVLIEEGIPLIGEKLVEEGMKAMDVPAPVAKLAGKATKAGLKKPSQTAFKKSGLGLKSDLQKLMKQTKKTSEKVAKQTKKTSQKVADYVGSGIMRGNIELKARESLMNNPMVDGGMYPPPRRRGPPMKTLPYEVPMIGSGIKGKMHKVFGKDGQIVGAIREETSKIPYIGGRIFSDKLIDPLNKAYQPNPMVDQMGPENNSRRGQGQGLYAGLPAGRGMFV